MNKTLIVSEDLYSESETALLNLGFSLLKINRNDWMENAVSSHPDMYIANIGDFLLHDRSIAHLFDTSFDTKALVKCNRGVDKQNCGTYPHNVGFNCVNVGNKLFCNKSHTCKDILEFAEKANIEIINVNQGYAKCSTCIINSNAIITDDESIAKTAYRHNVEVLLVKKGFVKLKGYDYGFIGGCCGMIDNNLLAFNGNLKSHPSYYEIEEFCRSHSIDVLSLCDRELYDIGSVFRI